MTIINLPLYIRATIFLIGLYLLISMLYIGQSLIIPIVFATLFAILLNPVVSLLVKFRIGRSLAIFIALFFAFSVVITLFVFISSQGSSFSASFPILIDKFYLLINEEISNISGRFNLCAESINDYITKSKAEVMSHFSQMIGSTLSTIGGTLAVMFLIPVYVFMILYYQPLIIEFIYKLSEKKITSK